MRICTEWGVLFIINEKKMPKFAIANGLYMGRLPEQLRQMTIGTLSLLRPVKVFMKLVSFTASACSTQFVGHAYSTPLDTPIVLKTIPVDP